MKRPYVSQQGRTTGARQAASLFSSSFTLIMFPSLLLVCTSPDLNWWLHHVQTNKGMTPHFPAGNCIDKQSTFQQPALIWRHRTWPFFFSWFQRPVRWGTVLLANNRYHSTASKPSVSHTESSSPICYWVLELATPTTWITRAFTRVLLWGFLLFRPALCSKRA